MTNKKDWIPACTENFSSALSPESLYLLRLGLCFRRGSNSPQSLTTSMSSVTLVLPGRCSRRGSRLGHPRQLLHALLSVLVPDRTLPRTSLCSYLLRPCNRASLYLTRLGTAPALLYLSTSMWVAVFVTSYIPVGRMYIVLVGRLQ